MQGGTILRVVLSTIVQLLLQVKVVLAAFLAVSWHLSLASNYLLEGPGAG